MKSLCKLSKSDLAKVIPQLCEDLSECKYVCRKCGRLAPGKDWLCKPTSIAKVLRREEEKSSAGKD